LLRYFRGYYVGHCEGPLVIYHPDQAEGGKGKGKIKFKVVKKGAVY